MENRITIQRLEETAEWLAELKVKLAEKLRKAPEGVLHSKNCRGTQQFYVKKDGIRKYLRKSDWNLAKQIAQRDYHKKLLSQVCSDLTYLDTFLRKFDVDKLYDIYDELPIARQKLVNSILQSGNRSFMIETILRKEARKFIPNAAKEWRHTPKKKKHLTFPTLPYKMMLGLKQMLI